MSQARRLKQIVEMYPTLQSDTEKRLWAKDIGEFLQESDIVEVLSLMERFGAARAKEKEFDYQLSRLGGQERLDDWKSAREELDDVEDSIRELADMYFEKKEK